MFLIIFSTVVLETNNTNSCLCVAPVFKQVTELVTDAPISNIKMLGNLML